MRFALYLAFSSRHEVSSIFSSLAVVGKTQTKQHIFWRKRIHVHGKLLALSLGKIQLECKFLFLHKMWFAHILINFISKLEFRNIRLKELCFLACLLKRAYGRVNVVLCVHGGERRSQACRAFSYRRKPYCLRKNAHP